MPQEKVSAQIVVEVDEKSAKKSSEQLKRIASPQAVKMSLDIAQLEADLKRVRAKITKSVKEGNREAEVAGRAQARLLSKRITNANRELNNFINTGKKETSALGQHFDRLGKSIVGAFKNFLKFAGGLYVINRINWALRDSISASLSFQDAFTGVAKTVDTSQENLEKLDKQLRNLATREIPLPYEELARIAEIAGQLGVRVEDIKDFTKVIAQLGVTTDLSIEDASFALARFQSILGVTGEDLDNLGSVIVDLGNNYATTESKIVTFAERILGTSSVVGLTAQEVLAISTAFSAVGIEAELWGTAVQRALLEINNAVSTGADSIGLLAKVSGTTAQDFVERWDSEPGKVFADFVEGLGKAGDDASKVIGELFGDNIRMQQAFLTVAESGGTLTEAIERANIAFGDANALQKEAEKRFKTNSSQLQLQKNRWRELGAEIGDVLLNRLVPLSEKLTNIATFDLPIVALAFKKTIDYVGDLWSIFTVNLFWRIEMAFNNISLKVRTWVINTKAYLTDLGTNMRIFGSNIVTILGNAWNNIGESFKYVPIAIQAGVNLAIWAIETLANGAISAINKVTNLASKLPGVGEKIAGALNIGSVSLQRADFGVSWPNLRTLGEGTASFTSSARLEGSIQAGNLAREVTDRNQVINDLLTQEAQIFTDNQNARSKAINDAIIERGGLVEETIEKTKDQIKKQIIEEQEALEWLFSDIGGGGVGGGGKTAKEKELEDLKEIEKEKRDVLADSLRLMKDAYQNEADAQKEVAQGLKDTIDELEDAVSDFEDLNDRIYESSRDTTSKLLDRYSEIWGEITDLEEKLADLAKGWVIQQDDLEEYAKVEKKIAELRRENEIAIWATTPEDRKAKNDYEALSEVEKILFDGEMERAKLEEERAITEERTGLKEQEARDQLAIKKEQYDTAIAYQESYESTIDEIESRITSLTRAQTDERIAIYEEEQIALEALIRKRREAGFASSSNTTGNTSNTVNNSPTVIVNAQIASGVDVDETAEAISRKIILSSKGIDD